jgi:Antirestriction protein
MTHHNDPIAIAATEVSETKRLETLPKHFGNHALKVESYIFRYLYELAPAYRGGFWHFHELSNGGFYMAPAGNPLRLEVLGNGFEGTLSAEAAGITVCLFAYSHLSFRYPQEECFSKHFHALREYALSHEEQRAIFQAID